MKLREKIRQIVVIQEPPHKIAAAFAVGVFLGMSPLIGFHTILGLFFAWALRLNRYITLAGVFITNPWTVVPIYTFGTWVGMKFTGIEDIVPHISWAHISFFGFISEFQPLLVSFLAGTTFVGLIAAVLSYFVIFHAVRITRG